MKTNKNTQSTKVNVNLSRVSEELQRILGNICTVSINESGIGIYNNLEEYSLTANEIDTLLHDAGVELRYCIAAECNRYCHQHSIRLVDKRNKEYTYTSYDKVERCYSDLLTARGILSQLQFMNQCAKMNHSFNIEIFTVPAPKHYAILDQDGRVVDYRSIYLLTNDDKTLVWEYCSYKSIACGCYFYSSREQAVDIIKGFDILKQLIGFSDLKFSIQEVNPYNINAADIDAKDRYLFRDIPVAKGMKTEAKRIYREYIKGY